MAAISTKGLKVCMSGLDAVATKLTPTAITKAKPAVVSVASVAGMAAGDVIRIKSEATGFTELDNKVWVVGTVNAGPNTFTLLGSDTTLSTGTLAATPSVSHYDTADMTCICFSEFTPNVNTPGTVSVATYCDLTASITNAVVEAGTITARGYVNITEAGYKFLIDAESDAGERMVRVALPNNGYLTAPVTVSSISWEMPIDGAQAFTANMTMATKMKHLF